MTVEITKECDTPSFLDFEKYVNTVIEAVLDYLDCPYEVRVEILLTDDEGIHELNRQYRKIDRPTDVLSFPMIDYETPGKLPDIEHASADYFDPDSGELILGDIVVSLDKVRQQAEEYGHSKEREFSFLIAHSMLHLFGYDHMSEQEAGDMEHIQNSILQTLGLTREKEVRHEEN